MTIVRSVRPEDVVTGTLALGAEGVKGGKAASLDLAALTGGKLRELPFNFRYFQNFDQEIALPSEFQPERLTVEVRSSRKGVSPADADVPLERGCGLSARALPEDRVLMFGRDSKSTPASTP